MIQKKWEIREHGGAIYTCDFFNGFLYTGSADNFVTRWDIQSGKQDKFAIKFKQSVFSLKIFENHFLAVGLTNGDVHIFDLNQRKELHFLKQHSKSIFSIAFNSVKNQLYLADAEGNLSVWDSKSFKKLLFLPTNVGKIRDMVVSPNGELIFLACQDETIRCFDTTSFNELRTWNAHKNGTNTLFFTAENLISGGKDAMLRLWNIEKEKQLKEIPAHNFAIYDIKQWGNFFLTASRDKTIKIWDKNLNFIHRLDAKTKGHSHSVNQISIINDFLFASISDDRRIIIWELKSE